MPSFTRPSARPVSRARGLLADPAPPPAPVGSGVDPTVPGAPRTSSKVGVASIRLNSVVADCGVVEVALNAATL